MDHPEVTQAPEDGFWDLPQHKSWLQSQPLNEPEELPEEVSQFGFL